MFLRTFAAQNPMPSNRCEIGSLRKYQRLPSILAACRNPNLNSVMIKPANAQIVVDPGEDIPTSQNPTCGILTGTWFLHDTRDQIVDFVRRWSEKTDIGAGRFIGWLDCQQVLRLRYGT